MLISTHVLVGTMLGRLLARRAPSVKLGAVEVLSVAAVGVASHFACDALPHWGAGLAGGTRDPAFLAVAIPDGLTGLGLLGALTFRERGRRRMLVAACALGACLPDADKVGAFAVGRSPYPGWLDHWHGAIQRESPKLLASDVAIIAAVAALLLKRRSTMAGAAA